MAREDAEADRRAGGGCCAYRFQMVQSFALLTVSSGRIDRAAGRSQISIPPVEGTPIAFAEVDLKAVIQLDATGLKPVLASTASSRPGPTSSPGAVR